MFAHSTYRKTGMGGIVDVNAYRANPSSGGCPVIDLSRNLCAYGANDTIGCNALRECDPYTGNTHFEYSLPGGPSGNVDIAVYNSATGNTGYVYAPGVAQDVAEMNAAISKASSSAQQIQQSIAAQAPVTSTMPNTVSQASGSVNANVTSTIPGSNTPQLTQGTTAVSSLTQVGSNTMSWLEGNMISGIPNWMLVVGGLGLLLVVGHGKL